MATTVARRIDISGTPGQRLSGLPLRQVWGALIRGTALAALSMLLLFGVGDARAGNASTTVPAWSVTQLSGSAFIRPAADANAAWRPLRAGAVVAPGSVVMTAEDAHLVLGNGIDRVRLSGNSQVELPAAPERDAVTRVIHWLGDAFFQVGKRPPRQFEVDTPYLVAIVKGTKFTTTVGAAGASVKVSEGIVGVAPSAGGESIDLTAGQAASVSAGAMGRVSRGALSSAGPDATGSSASSGDSDGNHQGPAAGNAGGTRSDGGVGAAHGQDNSGGGGTGGGGSGAGGAGGGNGGTGGDGNGDGDGDNGGNDGDGQGCHHGHGHGHKDHCGCGGDGHGHGHHHGHGHGLQHASTIGGSSYPHLARREEAGDDLLG